MKADADMSNCSNKAPYNTGCLDQHLTQAGTAYMCSNRILGMSFPDQSMLKLGMPQAIANSRINMVDKGECCNVQKGVCKDTRALWALGIIKKKGDGRAS